MPATAIPCDDRLLRGIEGNGNFFAPIFPTCSQVPEVLSTRYHAKKSWLTSAIVFVRAPPTSHTACSVSTAGAGRLVAEPGRSDGRRDLHMAELGLHLVYH